MIATFDRDTIIEEHLSLQINFKPTNTYLCGQEYHVQPLRERVLYQKKSMEHFAFIK